MATAHERPVQFAGGTNAGYILLDPTTGAGGYKIAGGENGGLIFFGLMLIMFAIFIGSFIAIGAPVSAVLLPQIAFVVAGLLSAGSLFIAAAFAKIEGDNSLCGRLMNAGIGILVGTLAKIIPILGGIAAGGIWGFSSSEITAACNE